MAGGEQPAYDYGWRPTRYPHCPHCDRHWHGLALTEQIAVMYACGAFDEDYLHNKDNSRVLCQGSDFIGPMPAEESASLGVTYSYSGPIWTTSPARQLTVVVGSA